VGFFGRLFSQRLIPLEVALRRHCLEGGRALVAVKDHPPDATRTNILNALTKAFSVCAGGIALDFVQISKGSGDVSRALRMVKTDALIFETAAWCLADFSAYLLGSSQVPNDLRRPLAQALQRAVHEIGDMFGPTGAALLLQRIEGAPPSTNWQGRGEYFGSLLLCDRDKGGIVANITPSPVPDILWESGVVLDVAFHFHSDVINPQVDSALELVRNSLAVLSVLPE
jgi:hypothetical protein